MAQPDQPELGHGRWLVTIATSAVVAALLVAGLRARWEGWYPMGDNAFFALRALDVGTEHHPLLGTGSSASVTAGTTINNPGSLWFLWLAPTTKVAPVGGLVVAIVAAHVLATVGLVLALARAGGRRLAVTGAALAGALAWTLGSGLLVEPWQPHAMLFPWLAYLVVVWAIVAGRTELLPWAAGLASLLVQTHLTYAVAVPGLALVALGAVALRAKVEPGAWRRPLAVSGVVLAVAWAQPVADQLWGEGNLGALLRSLGGEDGEPVGVGTGVRYVAAVVAGPTSWARPGFADAFTPDPLDPSRPLGGVPSAGGALAGLGIVLALGALGWVCASRRQDRAARAALVVAAASVVLAIVTAAIIPIGPLGLGPHQLRYLWPVSLLVTAALALSLLGGRRRWTAAVAAAAVALGLLNLPAHHAGVGPDAVRTSMPVARSLFEQLDGLDRTQRYYVDAEGARLNEAFTTPLMLELQRRDIPFTVDHEFTLSQIGERRREDGRATVELYVVEGPAARAVPDGERHAAFVDGLTPAQAAERDALEAELRPWLAAGGLRLDDLGEVLVARGRFPIAAGLPDGGDATALLDADELGRLVRAGAVELDATWGPLLERWAELDLLERRDTVAVMARPMDGDGT